ncbi:MAG TPA: hypothetical protein VGD59_05275 [Acidisarcina sp.]
MSMTLHALTIFLLNLSRDVPAVLAGGAIAVLTASALGCSCLPSRAKDRLFKRQVY